MDVATRWSPDPLVRQVEAFQHASGDAKPLLQMHIDTTQGPWQYELRFRRWVLAPVELTYCTNGDGHVMLDVWDRADCKLADHRS